MKKNIIILSALAMLMGLSSLTGCSGGQRAESTAVETSAGAAKAEAETEASVEVASIENEIKADGGILVISVNPEIAVEYDNSGIVTGITARNNEALTIINNCQGLIGSKTKDAVNKLVTAIGEAGYFVEEVSGQTRQITIEIEAGSSLPYDGFMDEVVEEVKTCVNDHKWAAPLEVRNESDYGITDYVDTDYGLDNDGVTDYNDTDYGPNNDGVTDYNDTDYGPNNDGVTDYSDTDYGPNNDGVTDYNDTDYGPNNDGVTDYNDTDYGPNNDGVTDYGATDYGATNYGASDYSASIPAVPAQPQTQAPAPAPAPAPTPAYVPPVQNHSNNGDSGYGDSGYGGGSDYGNSGYGGSNYGDSGYDD